MSENRLTPLEIQAAVHKAELVALSKHVDHRFESSQKALDISAAEIHRRLEILNGEAERLRVMQATYLPRELWMSEHREVLKQLNELNTYKNTNSGRQSVVAIVVSVVVSALVSIGAVLIAGVVK